ncbi:MAG: hypothetical protein ACLRSW_10670 [Christensenellaceae bacterium]
MFRLALAMGDMTAEDLSAIRLAYPDKRFSANAAARIRRRKDEIAHKLNGFYAYFEKVRALRP